MLLLLLFFVECCSFSLKKKLYWTIKKHCIQDNFLFRFLFCSWFSFFSLHIFLFCFCILVLFCVLFNIGINVVFIKKINWQTKTVGLNIDFTRQWLERGKNCATDDTYLSVSETPAIIQASEPSIISRRSIASSSSTVSVTRIVDHSSAVKTKQRAGTKHRRLPAVHVKLAEENVPIEQIDSDSSTYDSFNEMETGSYTFNFLALYQHFSIYRLKFKNTTIDWISVFSLKFEMSFLTRNVWKWCSVLLMLIIALSYEDRVLFIYNFAHCLKQQIQFSSFS